jgi:hypothetical protein
LLRIDKINEKNVHDLLSENSAFAFIYETPEDVPDNYGECVTECKIPGFSLYPDESGVCKLCGGFG